MRRIKTHGLSRRLMAVLLCLCMAASMVSGYGIFRAATVAQAADTTRAAEPTKEIVEGTRMADPDTMDDYKNRLLTELTGSRYAGRVWTDKTVFAFGDGKKYTSDHFDGNNKITLNMDTDGYNGNVLFNADFAHIFSALASSQVVNEYPPSPVDLVIVFDMSGSMGQDTRYEIDPGGNYYVAHTTNSQANGESRGDGFPEQGVPMAERIENSRIQKTLDAINNTIDKLMKQNPQNRVAVCGYGANAVVLMPLGHYKKVNNQPYLSVGGMETLYHPSDLVYRKYNDDFKMGNKELPLDADQEEGWYWMNNRDTCYTVVVNAEYNTYTGILDDDGDAPDSVTGETYHWKPIEKTVSNNVRTDDGTPVKAFPGAWKDDGTPNNTHGELSREVYTKTSSGEKGWAAGLQGVLDSTGEDGQGLKDETGTRTSHLKEAMKPTSGLTADDYVGYFTNTQGGIYLAYKQLADSEATTYTETLTNGVVSTVARIPAAIIMSDGGANFSFNEMGDGDSSHKYTAEDWNARYGQRFYAGEEGKELQRDYLKANAWTNNSTPNWRKNNGQTEDQSRALFDGRPIDVEHLLGGATKDGDNGEQIQVYQKGDEWYNVFIPGKDTLGEKWDGLHGIYNQGADIYEDGTLSSPPVWDLAGIFYSSDNDVTGTAGTVMEVLLTASYMSNVVEMHYSNGWTKDNATEESKSELFTYTMNVDTVHVPLWGRMRLYPTLDPKEYNLEKIDEWYDVDANNDKFGTDDEIKNAVHYDPLKDHITKKLLFVGDEIPALGDGDTTDDTITGLKQAWEKFKGNQGTEGPNLINSNGSPVNIAIEPIQGDGVTYKAGGDDTITVTNKDVVDNIAYNDGFYDVTSSQMGDTFEKILALILGKVFVPVSGDNDAGVGDSITYQDPIGEYMEIKNGSITATPHHIGGDATGEGTPTTYDMALLLFGEMHGLVRAGVYDWQWNDEWMRLYNSGGVGTAAFTQGWYKGTPTEAGREPLESQYLHTDDSGTWPERDPKTGKTYSSAQEAWDDGWVMRFNFSTLLQFVPITGVTNPNVHPSDLPEQVKNTVYTCYRFAGTQEDRNELHRNPIYGDVPTDVEAAWQKAYEDTGRKQYPTGDDIYSGTPGVYRLSDIRVWVEDTGDFVDTDGAITPNSGYDRSLYVNIPAAAIPTELATITLGRDGVLSYETNLGSDHPQGSDITVEEDGKKVKETVDEAMYKNFCYQSTPFRLFYAVGLEEDLILRDDAGNQTGVDFNAISPEYISSHTVEGQDYVWFISNYYSETRYDEYATDSISRTRGDPTVTFSPGADNRYYVFQKPLPLYAHAYRAKNGVLTPVDNTGSTGWGANRSGNGSTTWENSETGGASWTGGQYMGTYKNQEAFATAYAAAQTEGKGTITDSSGIKYEYVENGIVFLQEDMLRHVTSKAEGGYTGDSVSFSSDDYFFLLVEFYVPYKDSVGKDNMGDPVPGTQGGHMVQYALARKGSEFGSGFASSEIDNGDMLCWTDAQNHLNLEFDYLSKSDTGDLTRGEPTYKKLTSDSTTLKSYLQTTCGITDSDILNQQVTYWTDMQSNPLVVAALKAAAGSGDTPSEEEFNKYFSFSVAARPGGIRSGDMSNNVQYKGTEYNGETGYYDNNVTKTSNTYYLPTVSDNSGTDDSVIINNYLGNNGRLEIANQMLHVTKMLEPPAGYELTDAQMDEEFNYQIFVQGVTGKRTAVRTEYNEYSGTWERELAYIDVLTDNSDLAQTNDSTRALFVLEETDSTLGGGSKIGIAKQVVYNNENVLYYANDDGTISTEAVSGNPTLYYLYLPTNGKDESSQHVHRLYQNTDYDGTDKEDFDLAESKNGTTTFVNEGQHEFTGTDPGEENRDSYRQASAQRPAGTKTYWAQDAELIPMNQVQTAEIALSDTKWEHSGSNHSDHQTLTYQTFLIRKPSGETSETNFASPFKTRTMYMTMELEFGKNANKDDGGPTEAPGQMTEADLYDQVVPSGDRPDLFMNVKGDVNGNIDNDYIAAHTAEFTLKHGEGLLLTGLQNRVSYRFTEKLTDDQLAEGYTLKEIGHVQQRGSDSIYRPGIQEIPIYSYKGATYGSEYGEYSSYLTEHGLTWAENPLATMSYEPFAHTNAVMWEYYATMAAGASGNHHQPTDATAEKEDSMQIWDGSHANTYTNTGEAHTVSDNPNCKAAASEDDLKEGYCDLVQSDSSILHYMYKNGELIDPHYNGEASTYLRNMARYGVSPTVHFGVKDEKTDFPAESNTDYTGVYSVFGNTGWFEEQAQFVNTFEPGNISITKDLKPYEGSVLTEQDKDTAFSFTLTLKTAGGVGMPDGVYSYVVTDKDGKEVKSGRLLPHDYEEADIGANDIKASDAGNTTWAFKLKGGETMTVTNLPTKSEFTYTITETTPDGGYEVTDSDKEPDNKDKTVTGTVGVGGEDVKPVEVTFTNTKKEPEPVKVSLQLQKKVNSTTTDKFEWTKDKTFTFLVTPDEDNPDDDPIVSQIGWDNTNGALTVTVSAPDGGGFTNTADVFKEMKFEKPGTYKYTVTEQTSDIPGISSDGKVYTVVVTVSEEYKGGVYTGKLKAEITVNGEVQTGPITVKFENKYNKNQVELPLRARKVLENGTIKENMFSFTLTYKSFEAETSSTAVAAANSGEPIGDVADTPEEQDTTEPAEQSESDDQESDSAENPQNTDQQPAEGQNESENEPKNEEPQDTTQTTPENNEQDTEPQDGEINLPTVQEGPTFEGQMQDDEPEDGTTEPGDSEPSPNDTAGEDNETDVGEDVPEDDTGDSEYDVMPTAITFGEGSTAVKKNDIYGIVDFGTMEFTEPGIYKFTIVEDIPEDKGNIEYDDTEYTITAYVTSVDGVLTLEKVEYKPDLPDGTSIPVFTNKVQTGDLVVSKTVTGVGETDKDFHFTVTFEPAESDFSKVTITKYDADNKATDEKFSIDADGKLEFTLKHGERVEVKGLPAGTTYNVTETEANEDGYTTTIKDGDGTITDGSGTIEADGKDEVKFTNDKPAPKPENGNLHVEKHVTGDGDKTKDFHFTVTFDPATGPEDVKITKNGEAAGLEIDDEGKLEFTLKDGEYVDIDGLPAGTTYTVTETEANQDGYTTRSTGATGTIPAGGTAKAEFTNSKNPPPGPETGNLVVEKTVTGELGDREKDWHFRVELSQPLTGQYGEMYFENGVAEFTLKHGQSMTATELPAGVTYTVTETEANQDGYTTSSTGGSGVIPDGGTAYARFVNDKDNPPPPPPPPPPTTPDKDLDVEKHVSGTTGEKDRDFHFRVELSQPLTGQYGDLYFQNGVAEFTLKDGQSVHASGLPDGVTYTVTEVEANQDGYKTNATGATGTLPGKAVFNNSRGDDTDLEVDKTVINGDTNKNFRFRIELSDKSINGVYGAFTFVDGVAEFTLRHGQKLHALGLPAGITYTVTEIDANADGYTTSSVGATGTLVEGVKSLADFINSKPDEPDIPHDDTPETGDNSRLGFWIALMFISLMGTVMTSCMLFGKWQLVSNKGKHLKK